MSWLKLAAAVAGPVAGALLGKKQGGKQTTITKLPDNQQRNVDLLMQGAEDLYKQGGPKYYEGNTVAPRSADTLTANEMARQFALGSGTDMANRAIASNNAWLNPEMLTNPNMIPGYSGVADDLSRRARISLTEDMLPSIRSSGVLAGGYGDTKNQNAQALAVARANEALQGQLSGLGLDTWSRAAGLQQQAIQMAPMLMSLGMQPAQIMQLIGAGNEAYDQRLIDAAREKWNFEQTRPYSNLEFFKQMTGRAGDYGGTNVTTTQGPSNTLTGAMQGLGAAGYLMSLLSGNPTGAAPIGLGTGGTTPGNFGLGVGTFGLGSNSFGQNNVDWGRILTPKLNPLVGMGG